MHEVRRRSAPGMIAIAQNRKGWEFNESNSAGSSTQSGRYMRAIEGRNPRMADAIGMQHAWTKEK